MFRTSTRLAAGAAVTAGLATALAPAPPAQAGAPHSATARPDHYQVRTGATLTASGRGVLANDIGHLTTVVRSTRTAHGTLALQPTGSFSYTPDTGYTGPDSFTYTTSDAVDLYRTNLPALASIGGADIKGGAYGSAFTADPRVPGRFYGLTDRGPNVDSADGTAKIEPIPDFQPAIGQFRLVDGKAVLVRRIPLRAADGTPFDGQVNCSASTGETILDLQGAALPCTATGYDPEGLVAMRDGSFWVSDEYGPFITHFSASGKQLGRLSPFDGSLPAELANRVPNKGMEGLTITPDGRTLVGIMQSALQQPDLTAKPANVPVVRIVTYDLRTRATHEYVYLLNDPKTNKGGVSEITALSATRFLVDERDGSLEPGAYKRLYLIDGSKATDVGPSSTVAGATYTGNAAGGGLLVGGATIEALAGDRTTADATAALAAAGITPVSTSLALDVAGLVTGLDSTGGFFGHDKIEGVAALNGGRTLVISNDNDFGLGGATGSSAPYGLVPKILPNGQQDDGEYLVVDRSKVTAEGVAPTTTATVTITVR